MAASSSANSGALSRAGQEGVEVLSQQQPQYSNESSNNLRAGQGRPSYAPSTQSEYSVAGGTAAPSFYTANSESGHSTTYADARDADMSSITRSESQASTIDDRTHTYAAQPHESQQATPTVGGPASILPPAALDQQGGYASHTSTVRGHPATDGDTGNADVAFAGNPSNDAATHIPVTTALPVVESMNPSAAVAPQDGQDRSRPEIVNHASTGSGKTATGITPSSPGKKSKSNQDGNSGDGSHTPGEEVLEDPEMAHLTDEQRRIVAEQVQLVMTPTVSFWGLFRYTTKFEMFLNFIGILGAIVAGAAQPLMTVVFGALTTSFTAFQLAKDQAPSLPNGDAVLARAREDLFKEVNKDVLYLVYIAIGMFVATWAYQSTFVYTGEASTRRIREAYLHGVMKQNVAYFDKLGAGEVTTRIETDTHLIQEGISDKISITVMFLATFFTGFIVAFVRNWRLALVLSTIIPAIAVSGAVMNKYLSAYKTQQLEEVGHASTLAEEVISSVRNTHAFSTQNKLVAMYDVRNVTTMDLGIKSSLFNGLGLSVFFFIIYSSYALAFYYGTTLLLQGRANAGQIVNVFFSILIGAFSLAQIAPNLQAVGYARGAATAIFATIDRQPVIDSSSDEGLKPEKVDGFIELRDVDFIYPSRPSVQVLYKFSAVFPRGKTTALVGGSGSGKSTIVGLCERFYDPVGGSVKLDGIELKELNVRWLRNQIGLVSQEPTLFAATVAGNIEMGLIGSKYENKSKDAKRERVIAAAKQANADGFISALPESYDTLIGERGMLLSGGQKQRIAIARAIISDPQILLLDEATSALDTASEVVVQDALDRASAGRTTITIAHRLSTIKDADQIIVLTAGHILESAMSTDGSSAHEILLRNPEGAYSRLVNAQKFREAEEEDAESGSDSASVDEREKSTAIGNLTREQVDEMARNEKPQFETLKRVGTGRSAASEALSQRNKEDLEKGRTKKQKHSFIYLIGRMLKLNSDRKMDYFLGLVAAILSGCVYPIFGIVFGGVLGIFSLDAQTQRAELRAGGNRFALYCFIIALVATVGIAVQNYYFGASAERLSRKLRKNTFASILRQDIAFFDRDENSTGHLTATIADYAQKINGLFGLTAGVIIQSCFTLLAGAIVGLSYAWKLALVGIACMPITIAAGVVRLRVVVLKDVKNKKSHEKSAQMACEAASAIRTVASLTREADCCRIYSEYLDEPMRVSNRTALWANMWYSISQSLTFLVIGLIFWYGSHQLVDGALSTRTFFVAMISIVFGSIQAGNVFNYVPDMSKARGAASDAVDLMDSRPDIDAEDPSGEKLTKCDGHIKFQDVHFRYPTRPHVRVLRGLDLEVKPGQFVAIVGPSGCGKSTLIQLVERFYDPLAGHVMVDGQDISRFNVNSYRDHVSLVSQEPTLYAGSVKFNITLGATVPADQVSQEQVERACKDANIHDFVMSLPDGYATEVGGKGTQLSGGQKQRIAIARALIRNPKILLLDEATSALDSESEKVVQRALDQAAKGRSTIAVAHRLSTIQAADIIYVLKDGRVAEQGRHFELLSKKGIYFELVSQQELEKHQ
ncbi:BZ3500_MvSof-1268-A1-R1_Chr3-1g05473 [Microbotryum saponariae]|uniref:BZ3500_MvSof-1268-A1-R1_Chr3-1g05473 protein n=1 Tax=Microbotryum saponariae TaxID=289078 RepID=A0A2X0N092_9BASI|nr:BZ3500_MvSof-1268-A1-R1_Chr3-1g05473 [Microbotryum saponariae]SDA04664.1 BZ3501_MvSof-1269-A2-R1_Chr3-1g05144 [Microbotryum saponariae]